MALAELLSGYQQVVGKFYFTTLQNSQQNADSFLGYRRLVCSLLMTRLEFNCLQSSQYAYYMHTIFIMNARDCYHNINSVKL